MLLKEKLQLVFLEFFPKTRFLVLLMKHWFLISEHCPEFDFKPIIHLPWLSQKRLQNWQIFLTVVEGHLQR
jgi:hypothetical protein